MDGAAGYAAQQWAAFATNRVNVGGPEVVEHYSALARAKLEAFHSALLSRGRRASVRPSRLYTPAEPKPSQTTDFGPMRALPADLTTAQQAASRVPYLKVVVRDRIGNVRRLHWASLYSGPEAAANHAVAMPGDGSLNRFRINGTTLERQRVTNPGSGSDFSVWTSFRTASRNVCVAQYGSTILAFAVDDATPTQIYWATSSDGGATFGAWALLLTAPWTVAYLAAASKSNGDTLLIFSDGTTVRKSKRVGGAWGSQADWTNSVASVTGLAVHYSNDFNCIVTGSEATTSHPSVWAVIYGDGFSQALDTWSALQIITQASAGLNVAYSRPFLANPDVYRLTYRDTYSGSGAYDRIVTSYSPPNSDFVSHLWLEPIPFNLGHDFGLALAASATAVWATTPARVYRAPLDNPDLELTDDVLEADLIDEAYNPRGGTIVLRNDDGRYNSPGSGAIATLGWAPRWTSRRGTPPPPAT